MSKKHSTSRPHVAKKVKLQLITNAYQQLYGGLLAAVSGATIIMIISYYHGYNAFVLLWYVTFLIVTFMRLMLTQLFFRQQSFENHWRFWRNVYCVSALLGGLCWGLTSLLLPFFVSETQQLLIILAIATVATWSMTTLSSILNAALLFIMATILPFTLIQILLYSTPHLYSAMASLLFLIFLMMNAVLAHTLIKKTIRYQCEIKILLNDMTIARDQLSGLDIFPDDNGMIKK